MDAVTGMNAQKKSPVQGIVDTAKQVIMDPVGFYRGMAKSGGFTDPLVFAVVLGVVTGIVQAIIGLVHLGPAVSAVMALGSIIIMPIMVLIFGFVGAAIVFVVWKLMGSSESYETAYRCGAYASAISPITAVTALIPVVGSLVGLGWMTYLLVMASIEVHKIPAKKAWLVFGIIAALFALMTLGAQAGARKAQRGMVDFQKEMGMTPGKDMTPEEAGKAAATFMKAMQEQAAKQQAQEQPAKEE